MSVFGEHRSHAWRSAGWHVARVLATLLLAAVAGAVLVCLAPGSGADDRELDPRLSEETRAAIAAERAAERHPARFVPRYLAGLARGDLGRSEAFGRPVRELVGERWMVTAQAMAGGLVMSWTAALALAALASAGVVPGLRFAAHGASGMMVAAPAALVALLLAAARLPASAGIAIVVFPKAYTTAEAMLRDAWTQPWVKAARARGVDGWRLFAAHVLRPSAGPLAGLAAVTIPVALGSSVPLEALGGQAGLGQLAWRATLARDVNLLVGMTLLISVVTLASNLAAEAAGSRPGGGGR
jgi:ABC-type dipeptide/oligopeptide/nickel transport system permease component